MIPDHQGCNLSIRDRQDCTLWYLTICDFGYLFTQEHIALNLNTIQETSPGSRSRSPTHLRASKFEVSFSPHSLLGQTCHITCPSTGLLELASCSWGFKTSHSFTYHNLENHCRRLVTNCWESFRARHCFTVHLQKHCRRAESESQAACQGPISWGPAQPCWRSTDDSLSLHMEGHSVTVLWREEHSALRHSECPLPPRTWSTLTSDFSAPNHWKDIKLLVHVLRISKNVWIFWGSSAH